MKTSPIFNLLFVLILLYSCKNEQENNGPHNLSSDYAFCNTQLSACTNGNGEYCLFGYKWGMDVTLPQAGFNAQGPGSSGGRVTFSFQEENGLVNTHRQINLPSKSFNAILSCAKIEIRNALNAWSAIAAIEIEEIPENSESDIQFYIADIIQSGIGYPNYPDDLCNELAGHVIIQSDLSIEDCKAFYIFALHEIGHVLGLGHVNTPNVMNPDFSSFNFQALQMGDTLGILAIYGEN